MRRFEKISFEQFRKDVIDDEELYKEYKLPSRETFYSAGYDFYSLKNFILNPGNIIKIPTGIKASMENNEVLFIFVRGSQGFKYNVRLCNQTGIIDKDYYNNQGNEGHIWVALQNEGSSDYIVKIGDRIAQGIFVNYLLTDDDDLSVKVMRRIKDDNYLKR